MRRRITNQRKSENIPVVLFWMATTQEHSHWLESVEEDDEDQMARQQEEQYLMTRNIRTHEVMGFRSNKAQHTGCNALYLYLNTKMTALEDLKSSYAHHCRLNPRQRKSYSRRC